ncbi:MAG: metallophosphatase, partial [Veillonella sp.]|nr:metallophosphatase [Veillonella sp.]
GGATSVDKAHRVEGESWWPQENASPEEMQEGIDTLAKHNWQVDYVVTHTAPKQFLNAFYKYMSFKQEVPCPTQDYLTELADKLDWDMWYFGHFHGDEKQVQVKARLLYDDIVLLGD